ncbi:MAG: DUF4296 domain-containing protein [Bacteroidota bacterium]
MKTNYKLRICIIKFPRSIFLILAAWILVLLFSCGSSQEKQIVIPSDVLPKEKMAEVIMDIHIAEAEADIIKLSDSSATDLDVSLGQKIFEKNKITKEQYEKSLSFYIDHPELLNEVYEKALNELSKMQGKIGGR